MSEENTEKGGGRLSYNQRQKIKDKRQKFRDNVIRRFLASARNDKVMEGSRVVAAVHTGVPLPLPLLIPLLSVIPIEAKRNEESPPQYLIA